MIKRENEFAEEVFPYLFEHKEEQGIVEIYSFKNTSVDGALRMKDGKVIVLEIKTRLNWLYDCKGADTKIT